MTKSTIIHGNQWVCWPLTPVTLTFDTCGLWPHSTYLANHTALSSSAKFTTAPASGCRPNTYSCKMATCVPRNKANKALVGGGWGLAPHRVVVCGYLLLSWPWGPLPQFGVAFPALLRSMLEPAIVTRCLLTYTPLWSHSINASSWNESFWCFRCNFLMNRGAMFSFRCFLKSHRARQYANITRVY